MPRYKCNSCDGEYDDISADGVPYYHRCPELISKYATALDPTVVRVPRPDERDENIAVPATPGGAVAEKKAGKGRLKIGA